MSEHNDTQKATEADLDDSQLESAAGGSVPYFPDIFGDKNGNGIPDILEPSPTFPTPEF